MVNLPEGHFLERMDTPPRPTFEDIAKADVQNYVNSNGGELQRRLKEIAFRDGDVCSLSEVEEALDTEGLVRDFAQSILGASKLDVETWSATKMYETIRAPESKAVRDLLTAFDLDAEQSGIDARELISPNASLFYLLAGQGLEILLNNSCAESEEDLLNDLEEFCLNNPAIGTRVEKTVDQGWFVNLKHFTIPGQDKPGYLTLAILPTGHAAPKHIHRGAGRLAGEYTVSLHGDLEYKDAEGGVAKHSAGDPVRISPDGSVDEYLPQKGLWVGIYIQPVRCKLAR